MVPDQNEDSNNSKIVESTKKGLQAVIPGFMKFKDGETPGYNTIKKSAFLCYKIQTIHGIIAIIN